MSHFDTISLRCGSYQQSDGRPDVKGTVNSLSSKEGAGEIGAERARAGGLAKESLQVQPNSQSEGEERIHQPLPANLFLSNCGVAVDAADSYPPRMGHRVNVQSRKRLLEC